MSEQPNHGDVRNQKTVYDVAKDSFITPRGPVSVAYISRQETVAERWCEVCKRWVTTRGIMGALLCPECATPWDDRYRDDGCDS